MLKRNHILVLLLVSVLVLSFSACSNGKTTDANADANEPKEVVNPVDDAVNNYFANMMEDGYKIDNVAFVEKVKAGDDMVILDIRQPDVYALGHIKGAINIPWGTAISDSLEKIPQDKPVMVYCYTGQTAGQTVALLNMAGFEAKSVTFGWTLGLEKVEGVKEVVETTVNTLDDATKTEIDADVKQAITEYYAGLAEVKDTTYANYKISEVDAKKVLDDKDDSIVFLSVRKAEDYAKGHIEGATNIPFAKGMQENFNTLPKDKKIIVYCYTGQTAGQTVAGLRLLGYDAVSLNGGMGTPANAPAGWANQGFPVVTE